MAIMLASGWTAMSFRTKVPHDCVECGNTIPTYTRNCYWRPVSLHQNRLREYLCIGCIWRALDAETDELSRAAELAHARRTELLKLSQ